MALSELSLLISHWLGLGFRLEQKLRLGFIVGLRLVKIRVRVSVKVRVLANATCRTLSQSGASGSQCLKLASCCVKTSSSRGIGRNPLK